MTISENLRVQALVEQGVKEVPKQVLWKVEEPLKSIASNPVGATKQVPVNIDLAGTLAAHKLGEPFLLPAQEAQLGKINLLPVITHLTQPPGLRVLHCRVAQQY